MAAFGLGTDFDDNTINSGFDSGGIFGGSGSSFQQNAVNQVAGAGAAPGAGLDSGSIFGEGSFFGKGGGAGVALGGLQTLGNIFNSFQQLKLAKDTLKFQKNAFKTNLGDQRKVFNTALQDRINSRFFTEGKTQAEADERIAERSL